jgi:seryl-tRNA synthetase
MVSKDSKKKLLSAVWFVVINHYQSLLSITNCYQQHGRRLLSRYQKRDKEMRSQNGAKLWEN